jgi:outer membrane protein TolC
MGLRELAGRAVVAAGVVKRAEHGVRAARRAVEEADAAQWPTLKLMAEGRNSNHRDRIARVLGPELAPVWKQPLSTINNDDTLLTGFDVTAPLYRGGLWGAREKIAREDARIAKLRQLQAVEGTLLRLVDLYLEVLLTEAAVSLETERERLVASEQGAKVSRAGDAFARSQMTLDSELELARIRARRDRRVSKMDLARGRLNALVGGNLETAYQLQKSFDVQAVGGDIQALVARARRGNLEVRVQVARAAMTRERVVEVTAADMPEVNFDYRYRYSSPTLRDAADSAYWKAAIRLDVPLFDGGRNRARKLQAREQRRGADLYVQELMAQVEAEVRAASRREARARGSLTKAQALVALARRNSRAVQDRVDGGNLGKVEAARAQVALLQARLEAFRVQAEVIRVRCRIHALAGDLVLDKF